MVDYTVDYWDTGEYENEELYEGHRTLLYDPEIYNKQIHRQYGNFKKVGRQKHDKWKSPYRYSHIKYKEDLLYVRPMSYKLKKIIDNYGHLKETTEIINISREDKEYIDYYNSLPSAPKIYTYLGDGSKVNMWHPLGDIYINTEFGVGYLDSHGYVIITGTLHKERYLKTYHRLVYEKYYGKIPHGYQIHHKDGNKLNNSIDNLEALTPYQHKQKHKEMD